MKPTIDQIAEQVTDDSEPVDDDSDKFGDPNMTSLSDLNMQDMVTVDGFGQMTRQQAIRSTITILILMADSLKQLQGFPEHSFDLAKAHYLAALLGNR
jgi:hypothetical protein